MPLCCFAHRRCGSHTPPAPRWRRVCMALTKLASSTARPGPALAGALPAPLVLNATTALTHLAVCPWVLISAAVKLVAAVLCSYSAGRAHRAAAQSFGCHPSFGILSFDGLCAESGTTTVGVTPQRRNGWGGAGVHALAALQHPAPGFSAVHPELSSGAATPTRCITIRIDGHWHWHWRPLTHRVPSLLLLPFVIRRRSLAIRPHGAASRPHRPLLRPCLPLLPGSACHTRPC